MERLMTTNGASDPALVEALLALEELGAPLAELVLTGRDLRPVSVFALGAMGVGRELARGVVREVEAEAPSNAMRLARHLFEQELDLHYLVNHPVAGVRQFGARDAKSRLAIARQLPDRPLSAAVRKALTAQRKEAYRLDALADERREAGEDVPASDLGFPTYEDKAQALDREEDYRFFYDGASWFSHPGVKASENQLLFDEARGVLRLRRSGSDPALSIMALDLGLQSLFNLTSRANWVLGPLPDLGGRLASFASDAQARILNAPPGQPQDKP